jgi:copper chaperone CopZ
LVEAVEAALNGVEGVTSAKANPVTGSLLIEHDGAPGREEVILAALYTVWPTDPGAPQ